MKADIERLETPETLSQNGEKIGVVCVELVLKKINKREKLKKKEKKDGQNIDHHSRK
jgi:hypothetical protein